MWFHSLMRQKVLENGAAVFTTFVPSDIVA